MARNLKSIPRIKATLDWFQVTYQLCQNTLYKAIWLPFTLMVSLGDSSLLLASHEQDIVSKTKRTALSNQNVLSLGLFSDSFQTGSFRLDCQDGQDSHFCDFSICSIAQYTLNQAQILM
jgi:hypothetical protein